MNSVDSLLVYHQLSSSRGYLIPVSCFWRTNWIIVFNGNAKCISHYDAKSDINQFVGIIQLEILVDLRILINMILCDWNLTHSLIILESRITVEIIMENEMHENYWCPISIFGYVVHFFCHSRSSYILWCVILRLTSRWW